MSGFEHIHTHSHYQQLLASFSLRLSLIASAFHPTVHPFDISSFRSFFLAIFPTFRSSNLSIFISIFWRSVRSSNRISIFLPFNISILTKVLSFFFFFHAIFFFFNSFDRSSFQVFRFFFFFLSTLAGRRLRRVTWPTWRLCFCRVWTPTRPTAPDSTRPSWRRPSSPIYRYIPVPDTAVVTVDGMVQYCWRGGAVGFWWNSRFRGAVWWRRY